MKNILITGGLGFVGSNLALYFKQLYKNSRIICLDNLKRRGSELNVKRLQKQGIQFLHGDIRCKEDFNEAGRIDMLLECSAEPSAFAGYDTAPDYLLNTNLSGTVNCLNYARKNKALFVFLSSSRVYPIQTINHLKYLETRTRFELSDNRVKGVSEKGFSEDLSLLGTRTLYGATKLCSELIIQEYLDMYNMKGIINRCGVLTGPWQMGKVDQGFIALWIAHHYKRLPLIYMGYAGSGKQVRDILHIRDLFDLLRLEITQLNKVNKKVFNVGGGLKNSVSLLELTAVCEKITGKKVVIKEDKRNRKGDIKYYVTDYSLINKILGWSPKLSLEQIVRDIYNWIQKNEKDLDFLFH